MMFKLVKKIVLVAVLVFLGMTAYQAYAGKENSYWPWQWHHDLPHKPKLDLKVSSECHYFQNGVDVGCFNKNGKEFGNWEATDLDCRHKFFNFPDLKPGDYGEDTIDLTVTNGDACGTMKIEDILDRGNTCVEPETVSSLDNDCRNKKPGAKEMNGEMRESMEFQIWLDQGQTLGFQGKSDPGEGDNVFNENDTMMKDWESIEKGPKLFQLRKFLRTARQRHWNDCNKSDGDGDGKKCKNNICNGVAKDGRLIEGVTYYIGFAWRLPEETGNEAQTDSLKFDLRFTAKSNESCKPCQNTCQHCEDRCED